MSLVHVDSQGKRRLCQHTNALLVYCPSEPVRFINVAEDGHDTHVQKGRERPAVHTTTGGARRRGPVSTSPTREQGAGNQGYVLSCIFFNNRKGESAIRRTRSLKYR